MCGIFDTYNYSFKWITYLVIITGIYTFFHWFVAVPLLYFHYYDCCNEKWTGNWVAWFLASSLGCWIGLFFLILLTWFCLRLFFTRHLNESNAHLTNKKHAKLPDVMMKVKSVTDDKNFDKRVKPEEIVVLPDLNPKGSFKILKMNDIHYENPVPETNIEIPADENRVHIQNQNVKAEKTPREIFFKNFIEGASDSRFGFDDDKVSEFFGNKYEKLDDDKKNLSYGKNENLTSEVMITLNEKILVDEC